MTVAGAGLGRRVPDLSTWTAGAFKVCIDAGIPAPASLPDKEEIHPNCLARGQGVCYTPTLAITQEASSAIAK
jgi:hypothetical protein